MSTAPANHETCHNCVSRRAVLGAFGVAGAALVVAGCSSADTGSSTASASSTTAGTTGTTPDSSAAGTPGSSAPGTAQSSTAESSAAAGTAVASLADVPVGGGVVLAAAGVVLTQPVAGTVLAFSAICTHAGCAVTDVADGAIRCLCHGSTFSVTDGSVIQGPARAPLPSAPVTVTGDDITLA